MVKSMNKSTGKFLKCILERPYFTEGKVYEILKDCVDDCYVEDDDGDAWYSVLNNETKVSYGDKDCFVFVNNVEIPPTENQKEEIVVGSKVWVVDSGKVTVDTIIEVNMRNRYCYETEKASYDKDGFVLMGNYQSERILLINETNQKALQVVYPQLDFETPKEKSLAEKRYDVIKKLYDSGKVVVIRHGDDEGNLAKVNVLKYLRGFYNVCPYDTGVGWKLAYAIDLDGNEITEVLDD